MNIFMTSLIDVNRANIYGAYTQSVHRPKFNPMTKGGYRISLRVLRDFEKGKKFQKREKRVNFL